jgi:hypothetical protein
MATDYSQLNIRDQYRLLDDYGNGYVSGTDVDIYIGNIHITTAIQWNWATNENTRPYYGYADYVPSKINHGSRVIQGELSLNLQNFSMFHKLIDSFNSTTPIDTNMDNVKTSYTNNFKETPVLDLTVNQVPKITSNSSGASVAAYVKAFKSQRNFGSLTNDTNVSAAIPNDRGIWELPRSKKFDVTIVFGGIIKDSLQIKYDHGTEGFEMIRAEPTKRSAQVATGMRFIDVEFMSCATNIGDDGRPIIQTYQWLARDIQVVTANQFTK